MFPSLFKCWAISNLPTARVSLRVTTFPQLVQSRSPLRSSLATSLLPQTGQVAFENLRLLLCDIALTTRLWFGPLDKTSDINVE